VPEPFRIVTVAGEDDPERAHVLGFVAVIITEAVELVVATSVNMLPYCAVAGAPVKVTVGVAERTAVDSDLGTAAR
jgi:ABC-type cobalamin transport system permease subunit